LPRQELVVDAGLTHVRPVLLLPLSLSDWDVGKYKVHFNPLKTKHRLPYLKAQSVPRS